MRINHILSFARYLFLFLIGLSNLYIFYFLLTPITIYASYYLLSVFYNVSWVSSNTFLISNSVIEIAPACVAGAAYYFLLILNLTTPMNSKKRIFSITFSLLCFFILNTLRIALMSFLIVKDSSFYALTHELTWHFGSTILLIIIWFSSVRLFRIAGIPFVTDFKDILKAVRKGQIRKSKKKRR